MGGGVLLGEGNGGLTPPIPGRIALGGQAAVVVGALLLLLGSRPEINDAKETVP